MDAESGQDRRPGGTVKPAPRAAAGKQRPAEPQTSLAERYELRDPFAEVTYRAKTLPEMVLQAERLGAVRFHAVAADGTRSPVERSNGEWKRSDVGEAPPTLSAKDNAQRTADAARIAPGAMEPESVVARIQAKSVQSARIEQLERELGERYVIERASVKIGAVTIGQTEYRYRGDTARIAFTESTFRLATDNNNPSVARSMVDVAEARYWHALRVSGHDDFRRMVWLEASLRGINTIGYEPKQTDRELLRKAHDARQINRIEPAVAGRVGEGGAAAKQSARGNGGRKAVLAALEAVLVARNVPARQREAVMAAAADNLAARLRKGEVHKVKVFDKSAPVQRPDVRPAREVQRTHDRTAPSR